MEPKAQKLDLFIPHAKIISRVKELSSDISKDYEGKPLLMLAVLKGALFFLADIARELTIPAQIDCIFLKSYEGTEASDDVIHHFGPLNDVKDTHVIIVEDIIDTGATIKAAMEKIKKLGARSVEVCSLLKRERGDKKTIEPKYTGFTLKDGFVIGYGLDLNEEHRNLKDIYLLK